MKNKFRIRECVLAGGAITVLLGAGILAGHLKNVPVSPSYYRLMSFLNFFCFAAIGSGLVVLPLRAKQPPSSLVSILRVFLAILFAILGLKAGTRYVHLCAAGSRVVEWSAMLGTPIIAVSLMFGIRRLSLAGFAAVALVAIVWICARPYLDIVHSS